MSIIDSISFTGHAKAKLCQRTMAEFGDTEQAKEDLRNVVSIKKLDDGKYRIWTKGWRTYILSEDKQKIITMYQVQRPF